MKNINEITKAEASEVKYILTDIDGVYDKNPREYPDAKLLTYVEDVEEIMDVAGGSGSKLGTGGMITKLIAAKIAKEHGIHTIIMNGNSPEGLYDIETGHINGTIINGGNKNG